MPELKLLFLQMAVVLACARLMGAAFRFIRQPAVVGEMAAGILLGPSFFGRIAPAAMNHLFPAAGLGALNIMSQVGLVLFMFLVGLEIRPGSLRGSARSVVVAGQASIIAPFLLGAALAWEIYPRLGEGAPRLPFVLFIGVAMSITAFPVLARILIDRGMMQTRVGLFAIACAAFNDLAAWCMLAVITVIANPEANPISLMWRFAALAGYILAMVFACRPALRKLMPSKVETGHFAAIAILLLLSVSATEAMGVHALFGAFVAGLAMPREDKLEQDLRGRLESVTLGLLLPLFFAYTGLRTSTGLLNTAGLWMLCAVIVAIAAGSKLVVSALAVRWSGIPWRDSLSVGVLMNCRGLVELVILNVGYDLHILPPVMFSMMVVMAFATTLMTAPLLDLLVRGESRGYPPFGGLQNPPKSR